MLGRLLGLMAFPLLGYGQLLDFPAIKSDQAVNSIMLDITYSSQDERLVAVGDRGHILFSDDQGTSWQQAEVPTRYMLTAVSFPSKSIGYAVGHQAVILKTEDAGRSWEKLHISQKAGDVLLDIWFGSDRHGIAVGSYGMALETMDGGRSWQSIAGKIPNQNEMHFNAIHQHRDNQLFLVGEKGILFRSDDNGKNWQKLISPYDGSWFGIESASDNRLLIYGLRGTVYQSVDSGKTWSSLDLTENTLFGSSRAKDGRTFFAGDSGTLLLLDKNRWFEHRLPNRVTLNDVIITADQHWVIVGERGIRKIKPEYQPITQ